jgi:negative regulator of sigma E activity
MTREHRNGDDKIETHYRLQLSALMDGALPPDEARFLVRRLQHDTGLGGCWERWQMIGETLRGRAVAPLPAGFSQRIATLVAAEPVPVRGSTRTPRWTRWGGGALAASVALVALFMARQPPPVDTAADNPPTRVVAASSAPPARQPPEPAAPDKPAVDPDAASAAAATGVAVAEVPRRAANRRVSSSRSQAQRAALRAAARGNENLPIAVAASNTPAPDAGPPAITFHPAASSVVASSDPFASQPIAPSRPWPSATLPQFSSGALSVDYGTTNAYYPFQPRLPVSSPTADSESDASLQDTPQR